MMTRRPIINFDPLNPEHRRDALTLMQNKGFSFCKNIYNLEGNYGDTRSMITDKILRYYLSHEFDPVS